MVLMCLFLYIGEVVKYKVAIFIRLQNTIDCNDAWHILLRRIKLGFRIVLTFDKKCEKLFESGVVLFTGKCVVEK
jgi:hypothetical protein